MALTDKGLIKITSAGTEIIFAPQALRVKHMSLSTPNSGRAANGDMSLEWVKGGTSGGAFYAVPVLEIELPPHQIDDELYTRIQSHVLGQTYRCEFYDTLQHQWETTADFYTADTGSDWYSGVVLDGIVQGETFTATGLYNHRYLRYNPQRLVAPSISLVGTTVSWNAIPQATGYIVRDNGAETSQTTRTYTISNTNIAHNIQVKATAGGTMTDSEWSNLVEYDPPVQFSVTNYPLGAGYVSTSGTGYYRPGDTAVLTAHANDGYYFRYWTVGGSNYFNNPLRYEVTRTTPLTVPVQATYAVVENANVDVHYHDGTGNAPYYYINSSAYNGDKTLDVETGDTITCYTDSPFFVFWSMNGQTYHGRTLTFTATEGSTRVDIYFDTAGNYDASEVIWDDTVGDGFIVDGMAQDNEDFEVRCLKNETVNANDRYASVEAIPGEYVFKQWNYYGDLFSSTNPTTIPIEVDTAGEYECVIGEAPDYYEVTFTSNDVQYIKIDGHNYALPYTYRGPSATIAVEMEVIDSDLGKGFSYYNINNGQKKVHCAKMNYPVTQNATIRANYVDDAECTEIYTEPSGESDCYVIIDDYGTPWYYNDGDALLIYPESYSSSSTCKIEAHALSSSHSFSHWQDASAGEIYSTNPVINNFEIYNGDYGTIELDAVWEEI